MQAIIQNAIQLDPNSNTVKIANDQLIGLNPDKNDVKATIKNFIGIDENQNRVKASLEHKVELADNQQVGIHPDNNHVMATLTHPVELIPEQLNGIKVRLDEEHNIIKYKPKRKAFKSLPTIRFNLPEGGDPNNLIEQQIYENPKRDVLILTADPNNAEPIWIDRDTSIPSDGTPLYHGDRIFLECSNSVRFYAKPDHVMYMGESTFQWWWH